MRGAHLIGEMGRQILVDFLAAHLVELFAAGKPAL